MRFRVLGSLELASDGGGLALLRSPRLRKLLALLLVRRGRVVPADTIADVLWGDDQPADPAGAVQSLVSRLRTTLRSSGIGDVAILTRAPGYVLDIAGEEVDATCFERLVAQAGGRMDDASQAAALLDEALALWRGPAYAEFADQEFAEAEAARLEELRLVAVSARVDAALAQGHHDEAVGLAEPLVTDHPLRERPRGQLMLALQRAGRSAEALEVFRDYRDRLADELGLDPSSDLRALESAIIRQEPAPGSAPPAADLAVSPGEAPPRTLGNLPLELTGLVGRAEDVARVSRELERARIVTLTGVGGVGKTRLALHVAAGAQAATPDGVWLCELAAVGPADVDDFVATTLGVQQRPGLTVSERLVEYLQPRSLLVILDNCEHVIDAACRLAAALVGGCPRVTVLATSREPLGLRGEHVMPVQPLAVPPAGAADLDQVAGVPAVALFAERASEASPSFTLTSDNVRHVGEICRRLDGLPLALELAATKVRAMGPAEIAERLGHHQPFLRTAERVREERHRTLRAVVDWSYQLLDEDQRRTFERLAVFASAFTLVDAERIAVDHGDVADIVTALVDRSMLVAHTDVAPTRYAFLETLRSYGLERLAERDDGDATHAAHAHYHVEVAERAANGLTGADEHASAAAFEQRFDELRVAHRWALENDLDLAVRLAAALCWYVETRASWEAAQWAERTVEAAAGSADPLMAVALTTAAMGARNRGNLAEATRLAQLALHAAGDAGDPRRRHALYVLGDIVGFEGRVDEASRLYAEAERLAALAGDRFTVAFTAAMRALPMAYGGEESAALEMAERARGLALPTGNPTAQAWADYAVAEALLDKDPERAMAAAEDALRTAKAVGSRFLAGVALVSTASLHGRHGDPDRALVLFDEVIDHWRRDGNWTQQWTTLRNLVDLLVRVRADADAATLHGALTTRAGPPAWGADAGRLARGAEVLRARLGEERVAEAAARGAAFSDEEAVAFAVACITRLRQG